MLSYQTVDPHTLELLRLLMKEPSLAETREYPWLDEAITEDGLRLASPIDIAAMKIYAIENRGSRKDFIDMYFLLKHYSLSEILQFYKRKYPEHSEFVALRSLTYFEDAESYAMPTMFAELDWEELKRSIIKAVNEYTA